jgi:hypothetical protein
MAKPNSLLAATMGFCSCPITPVALTGTVGAAHAGTTAMAEITADAANNTRNFFI